MHLGHPLFVPSYQLFPQALFHATCMLLAHWTSSFDFRPCGIVKRIAQLMLSARTATSQALISVTLYYREMIMGAGTTAEALIGEICI